MSEEYIQADVFIHRRDGEGKLLPVDVNIEEMNGKVKIMPMTKGEIQKIQSEMVGTVTTLEQDKELILKHVIEPKFNENDIEFFKPIEFGRLVSAIMVASGVPKDKINQAAKKLVEKRDPLSK